jgi:hypothetical protein
MAAKAIASRRLCVVFTSRGRTEWAYFLLTFVNIGLTSNGNLQSLWTRVLARTRAEVTMLPERVPATLHFGGAWSTRWRHDSEKKSATCAWKTPSGSIRCCLVPIAVWVAPGSRWLPAPCQQHRLYTASDHIEVFDAVPAQLPAHLRRSDEHGCRLSGCSASL